MILTFRNRGIRFLLRTGGCRWILSGNATRCVRRGRPDRFTRVRFGPLRRRLLRGSLALRFRHHSV